MEPLFWAATGVAGAATTWFGWLGAKKAASAVSTKVSTAVHGKTNAIAADVASLKTDMAAVKAKVGA